RPAIWRATQLKWLKRVRFEPARPGAASRRWLPGWSERQRPGDSRGTHKVRGTVSWNHTLKRTVEMDGGWCADAKPARNKPTKCPLRGGSVQSAGGPRLKGSPGVAALASAGKSAAAT